MACTREQLNAFLDALLRPEQFQDYCPNGLQVEGRADIQHLVTGVTASEALLVAARERNADAVLVHHGYFWRSEDPRITGMKATRLRTLIQADMSLFAYHLPLDCHPECGNNVLLGKLMGIETPEPLGADNVGSPLFGGQLTAPIDLQALGQCLETALGRKPLLIGEGPVQSVAWCTGAGQGYIDQAADAGADVYVTGEVSEQTVHIARERGIAFIAAGHHATERYGVQAVGELASQTLGFSHEFVDIDNPV